MPGIQCRHGRNWLTNWRSHLEDYISTILESGIVAGIVSHTGRESRTDGFIIQVRIELVNAWLMDCWERVEPDARRYAYHVFNGQEMITRRDNSRYHPEVSTHPFHQHIASSIVESEEMDISDVLTQLEGMI